MQHSDITVAAAAEYLNLHYAPDKNLALKEIEWKKERVEKDSKEKTKKREKEEYAMVPTWGPGTDESDDDEEIYETALLAIGDSDLEEEEEEEEGSSEVRVKESKKHWYLDSACSRHMTSDQKKILLLSKISGGRVSFGVKVIRIDTMKQVPQPVSFSDSEAIEYTKPFSSYTELDIPFHINMHIFKTVDDYLDQCYTFRSDNSFVVKLSLFGLPEVYEFYTNGSAKENLFTTTVYGVFMYLAAEDEDRILKIPLRGWDNYMKFCWPSLDNMASTLAITRKFLGNPNLIQHRRILKKEMSPLHQLYFDVWSLQTTKNILRRLNHNALPISMRQADTPMQRLRNELVDALSELDEVKTTYAIEREGLQAQI
ncbi:hypothetical protein FXO38_28653 [Capsicum annuum]|nr:hypothetical protein FXO38_28653 [Capsicum annuum]